MTSAMTSLVNRWATPLIAGLFLVSLISGIALFFHWNAFWFHGMHEWLSMVLIVPFALHLWKNWRPMKAYIRKPAFAVAMVVSLLAAIVFVVPTIGATSGPRNGPAQFGMAQKMLGGSVAEIAAILDESPTSLAARLARAGFTITSPDQTLSGIAAASGQSDIAVMAVIAGQG
ncbi:DUF4405 domain-containing protein [Salipiger aestuarii]|uniref:DUF4405 domain-containing protein n=1 Tax=Salipiger aestuarii TaxID=568098 RepID=A0A327YAY1_9RHOB|nr:DUF4405 domain-containing protein [Salipiger aestuarii]RAK18163.1 hypothetical protein ATI53_101461 [Salipiger aestuarii]